MKPWVKRVFILEFKRAMTYRVEFWLQFLGFIVAQVGAAYFLWNSIYSYKGVEQIGGFTFPMMMIYYVLVPFIDRMSRSGDDLGIANDIYSGGLTRYLLYPLSFFSYKYVSRLAHSIIAAIQLVIAGSFLAAFGLFPEELHLSLSSILLGLVACGVSGLLYFSIVASLEMISFWADNVWSFVVLLKTLTYFLGGGVVPLALFPDQAQALLAYTPFPLLLSFPLRTFLGQVTLAEYSQSLFIAMVWMLGMSMVASLVWRKGRLQYTGVGM